MSLAELLPPLAGLLAAMFVGAWLITEIGFRIGAFRRERVSAATTSGAGTTLLGALLALLAFMLAFTFGVSVSRADNRRQLVIDEANAVSTAFLRADLLESPWAERIRDHLREYADVRIAAAMAPETTEAGIERSEELHGLMWAQAIEATSNRAVPADSLVLESLNNIIDLHTDRITASSDRLGAPVWGILILLAAVGTMAIGYDAGLTGLRPSLVGVLLIIAFSVVVVLIVDLDAPQSGWLRTPQEAMQEVARAMRADR